MNKNKYYSGIDWMRLIAAVLVITIHTSPLASYNRRFYPDKGHSPCCRSFLFHDNGIFYIVKVSL